MLAASWWGISLRGARRRGLLILEQSDGTGKRLPMGMVIGMAAVGGKGETMSVYTLDPVTRTVIGCGLPLDVCVVCVGPSLGVGGPCVAKNRLSRGAVGGLGAAGAARW